VRMHPMSCTLLRFCQFHSSAWSNMSFKLVKRSDSVSSYHRAPTMHPSSQPV
jgi:hypothetical protein